MKEQNGTVANGRRNVYRRVRKIEYVSNGGAPLITLVAETRSYYTLPGTWAPQEASSATTTFRGVLTSHFNETFFLLNAINKIMDHLERTPTKNKGKKKRKKDLGTQSITPTNHDQPPSSTPTTHCPVHSLSSSMAKKTSFSLFLTNCVKSKSSVAGNVWKRCSGRMAKCKCNLRRNLLFTTLTCSDVKIESSSMTKRIAYFSILRDYNSKKMNCS